jgi:hypothetical protein
VVRNAIRVDGGRISFELDTRRTISSTKNTVSIPLRRPECLQFFNQVGSVFKYQFRQTFVAAYFTWNVQHVLFVAGFFASAGPADIFDRSIVP